VSAGAAGPIRTAEPAEAPYLGGLIAAAFHPLAAARWQIGDDALRRAVFPGYFEGYVYQAFGAGLVQTTHDRTAAALWLFEDGRPQPAPERPDPHAAAMLGPWAERVYAFDCLLHEALPAPGRPFEHLAILAVLPGRQGRGSGTALLEHRLAHLDRAQTPAYLEASGEDTRGIYLKHGFADHGEPIRFPDGPRMYPMWREPGTPAPNGSAARGDAGSGGRS
jgi:GNAT superfamily N-acetyltransferase